MKVYSPRFFATKAFLAYKITRSVCLIIGSVQSKLDAVFPKQTLLNLELNFEGLMLLLLKLKTEFDFFNCLL